MFRWKKSWAGSKGTVPWDQVGRELGTEIVSASDDLLRRYKDTFNAVSGRGISELPSSRLRYEFCLYRMFWTCYVGNSPRLRKTGVTEPFLDAYVRSCCDALVEAGLVGSTVKDMRAWEADRDERFMGYKAAYEVTAPAAERGEPVLIHTAAGAPTVGWMFVRYLFPGQTPDPRLVTLINMHGSIEFTGLASIFTRGSAANKLVAIPVVSYRAARG